ncbi:DUF3298 domain-containing protein [Aureisphaera galaxeae]|uniref:RsiV family protein n=1 Tax=Aureisphaera galaxeae TaxID=1538023 RepID=UPI002350AC09|nr:DUF3298 domain-containing protein [Aureisphaera galaxeae]MDC8003751.1 DUF3298 domain-containing protein [Aureisphaera galaxeae]
MAKKKKWYKKIWLKILAFLGFLAILFGSLADGVSVFDRFSNKTKTELEQPHQTISITDNSNKEVINVENINIITPNESEEYIDISFKEIKEDYSYTTNFKSKDGVINYSMTCQMPIIKSNSGFDLSKLETIIGKDFFGESFRNNLSLNENMDLVGNKFISEEKRFVNKENLKEVFGNGLKSTKNRKMKILFNDKNILSYKIEGQYYQTGMAHDQFYHLYYIYNLESMRELYFTDVFLGNARKGLTKKIIERLKVLNGLEYYEKLNDNGYWEQKIQVPEKFYINEVGICFVFSEYEIISFAAGRQNVCFEFEELKLFLNESFPFNKFF